LESVQFLCRSDELVAGAFREMKAEINGQLSHLVVTRHQGSVRAWLNICPHQGRPLNWAPDRFLVDKHGQLVCAAHGAVFEPDQGICVSGPCLRAGLTPVNVVERNDKVYIDGLV
jgi:nitrite reductase/ring-hydroxylating ferredoxin subunit